MKILAFDTATEQLALGLSDGTRNYTCDLHLGARHSNFLLSVVERSLVAAGCKFQDIDYIACGQGPGSFTGIRIGVSTAKGLAWSQNKPVIGISTLETIACNALANIDRHVKAPIVAFCDAKRSLVYACVFRVRNQRLVRDSGYLLLPPDALIRKLPSRSILVGDAVGLYRDVLARSKKQFILTDPEAWYPRGVTLLALAQQKIQQHKSVSAAALKAIYVYPKECQIKAGTVLKPK